jgi:hypothetical protein
MEMGMMSMAQNATLTTLLMSQLVPVLGQNQGVDLSGRPLHWNSTTTIPFHHSPPSQMLSSPPISRVAKKMSLDDFIHEYGLERMRTKIDSIGWEPGQSVKHLEKDEWAREMIFGSTGAGFKLMEWKEFLKAAEAIRK